jgi:hypothetical protein
MIKKKNDKLIIFGIILIVLLFVISGIYLFSRKDKYVGNFKTQDWLEEMPNKIIIEYSMMGFDLPPLSEQNEIEVIMMLLKDVKFLSADPEILHGLGYGLRLEYNNFNIRYYFGSTDRVWIYKNNKRLCGYMIERTSGEELFEIFNYYAGNFLK